MKWIHRFLGLNTKAQEQKSASVDEHVQRQQQKFKVAMSKLKQKTIEDKDKSRENIESSARIAHYVEDLTYRMAMATGGKLVHNG